MGFEGHSFRPNKEPDLATGTENVHKKLESKLQIALANKQFSEKHPDISDPDRNEVMTEFITSGAAEDFRREFGSLDEEGLRNALETVLGRTDETLH